MGFGSVIECNECLQLATTSKDYALTVVHISQITMGLTKSSQSVPVVTGWWLVVASNGGSSRSSGSLNCPPPQLPHNS
jgi:hypothetical protein